MKFTRNETPTIMDGMVIRWTCDMGWRHTPEISASRNGVCIGGAWPIISNREELDGVVEQLREAYEHFGVLRSQR